MCSRSWRRAQTPLHQLHVRMRPTTLSRKSILLPLFRSRRIKRWTSWSSSAFREVRAANQMNRRPRLDDEAPMKTANPNNSLVTCGLVAVALALMLQPTRSEAQRSGVQQAIKVHGDWVIEVRNPDG